MTVADFEWNTNAYNADYSLWKALYTSFGNETAKELLLFNDKFYELVEYCKRLESEGKSDALISKTNNIVEELNRINEVLQKELTENKTLAGEIETFKNEQIKKLKAIEK